MKKKWGISVEWHPMVRRFFAKFRKRKPNLCVGKINSTFFAGRGPRTCLCTNCAINDEKNEEFTMTFTFKHKRDGWDAILAEKILHLYFDVDFNMIGKVK